MIKQVTLSLVAAVLSVPLAAQVPQGQTVEPKNPNKKVIAAMGVKFTAAKCSPKGDGHFLVSAVKTYYNQNFEAKEADAKAKLLRKANEVAKDAILNKSQDKNGGAWYWLGRVYLQQGDIPGADTALTRAQTLLPECAQEIKSYRQLAYTALVAPAVQLLRDGKTDSAIAMFHEANLMSQESPGAVFNMAIAYSDDNADSSIKYFKIAQTISATNPQFSKERDAATANLASLYQSKKGMDAEAVAEARKALAWSPDDPDSKRLLYSILARSKDAAHQAEAKKIQSELLTAAEADGSISAGDLARMGVDQFVNKNYDKAAEYFEKAYAKEPWRRDILFNVINAHFAQKQYAKMLPDLEKQIASEPLNTDFYKLLIAASQNSGTTKADSARTLDIATRYFSMVSSAVFEPLVPQAEGAELKGEATGMEGTDPKTGKALPAAPVVLVFEFLDNKGAVVSTTEATLPALAPDAKAPISVKGTGKGIVDWRYHKK